MENNNKEIRNILMTEFKNEERIWAMQSFFGRESVIEIIKYFNDSLIEENKRLLEALKNYENEFQKLLTTPLGKENEKSLKIWFSIVSSDAKNIIKNNNLTKLPCKNEAIDFLEWADKNNWKRHYPKEGNPAWHAMGFNPLFNIKTPYTTKQVYEFYKSENKI